MTTSTAGRGRLPWSGRRRVCGRSTVWAAVALMTVASPVFPQDPPRLSGRVVDATTGMGVEGATVALSLLSSPDVDPQLAVTDGLGLFAFQRARPGRYELSVDHLGYGSHSEALVLVTGEQIALRVTVSRTAITLDPVVVEASRAESASGRASGAAARRVTFDDLGPIAETGTTLVNALAQLLPGMRVGGGRSQPGQLVCLEFRNPSSLSEHGCLPPVVVVDNVRQGNGLVTLNTIPMADIRAVEALGPGEAGVRYGSDGRYGVILIETFTGGTLGGADREALPSVYNWALESEPYPWAKALGVAALGNAIGLLGGVAVARSCLSFDTLTRHFYEAECGFLGNSGARLALYAGPPALVGYLIQRVGATELSRGNQWRNAVATAIMSTPGVVLALTSEEDGFSGSQVIGSVMVSLGAPVAAVLADRLFRRVIP